MAYSNIDKPNQYFNTVLYSGTGSSNSVTGVGFQPDWTWIKSRNNTRNHNVYDSVRGTTKVLYIDTNDAESTQASGLTAFNSDGFTVVSDLGVNGASDNYASWNWLAGGTASSNTDGSITSSVSVSPTSGISIGTFTGTGANATIGHGLGAVPKYLWVKRRDGAGDWMVYHVSKGNTGALFYNSTNAGATSSTYWQDTTPTSSVFSIGSNSNLNTSGESHSFVAFAEKKGYSKFGSYTGNGNVDGTVVYTGFKPAWLMYKQTNASGESWIMHDNKRGNQGAGANPQDLRLLANATNTEADEDIDFLSNGFKCRVSGAFQNGSGSTYAYMAFAESPLVGSNFVPTNAR
jgi:hypothetical protein